MASASSEKAGEIHFHPSVSIGGAPVELSAASTRLVSFMAAARNGGSELSEEEIRLLGECQARIVEAARRGEYDAEVGVLSTRLFTYLRHRGFGLRVAEKRTTDGTPADTYVTWISW